MQMTLITFFSADYKALPNGNSKPMYHATGGKSNMTYEKGALTITNARFTIGMPDDHHPTGVTRSMTKLDCF